MRTLILFLLISLSINSQVRKEGPNGGGNTIVTIDGIDYVATGVLDGSSKLFHYSFLADAELRGYDFSNERGTLDVVGHLPANVGGRSYDSCAPGYDIDLNSDYWSTASFRQKKILVYHEFGHALMNLRHACLTANLEYWGEQEVIDIMTNVFECSDPDVNPPFPLRLEDAVNRMFNPAYQRPLTYYNCPAGSGTPSSRKRVHYIDD